MRTLTFPGLFKEVDWIVSVAKMKTHHWAGATLSMKNLFGVMPGIYYGWPKNVLHQAGIENSILDINATLKPHFAIVDGIVGMEGDGPIMGDPKKVGCARDGTQSWRRSMRPAAGSWASIPIRVSYLEQSRQLAGADWRRIDRTARRIDCRGADELQSDRIRFRLIKAYDSRKR